MSTKSLEATLKLRMANVPLLQQKYDTLKAFKHAPLSKTDLQTLGITLSRLELQNQRTPFAAGKLQFFQPLPLSSIKRVPPTNERALEYEFPKRNWIVTLQTDDNLREFVRSVERGPGRKGICKWKTTHTVSVFESPPSTPPPQEKFIGGMHEFPIPKFNNAPYEWHATQAYDTDDREYPHQVMRSLHGINELSKDVEATVLRSEMILLITTILSRMDNRNLIEHAIYPGYFDGKTLHVAFSDFVDHRPPGKNRDLMLQWLLSDPVGDTKKVPQAASSAKSKTITSR